MLLPAWLFFCVAAFLTEGSMMCLIIAQPIFALDRWAATAGELGLFGLATGGCYCAMAVIAGWMLGRGMPARPAMALGLGSQAALILIEPHCPSLRDFMALAALQFLLLGFFWTSFQKTLAEVYSPEKLAVALGRFNISWSSGAAIGVWISGRLYERLGPSAPFIASATMLSVAFWIVTFTRPRRAPAPSEAPSLPLQTMRGDSAGFVYRAWLGLWACSFVAANLINLFPLLARSRPFMLGPAGISNLHTLRQGAMFIAFIGAGATTHWRFRRYPLHLCLGLIVVSMAALSLAQSTAWLAFAFAAIGLATGLAFAFSVYYSLYHPESRATRVGVHEAMLASAMAIGPIAGGKIDAMTGSAKAPYVACLAGAALIWVVYGIVDAKRRGAQFADHAL